MQIARFTVIGVASTIAYVLLFLLLRGVMSAQAANLVSLGVTAVANTAANRRLYRHWVFGRPKRAPDAWHHQGQVIGTVHANEMATQGERTN